MSGHAVSGLVSQVELFSHGLGYRCLCWRAHTAVSLRSRVGCRRHAVLYMLLRASGGLCALGLRDRWNRSSCSAFGPFTVSRLVAHWDPTGFGDIFGPICG
jgi:hypothetical protein